MALPKCEGLITIPAGTQLNITEDSGARTATITITAGTYYWGTAGSVGASLASTIASIATANGTLTGTYAGSVDDNSDTSTGKFSLTVSGGASNHRLTFTSSTLRDIMGFTGTTGFAATNTGTEQVEYLWLPNTGRTNPLAPEPTVSSTFPYLGIRETDGTASLSPSGYSARLQYSTRYRDSFEFAPLLGSKVWKSLESTTNESFEKFYEQVVGIGLRFRYHSSRDSDTVFWTQFIEDFRDFKATAYDPNWTGANSHWRLRYTMRPQLD